LLGRRCVPLAHDCLVYGLAMFGLVASICLLLCFDLLVAAHLTWLVAWLSCLPCRTWCNIIIIALAQTAQFRHSNHNLGVGLGRHQGVVWFAHGCKRCAALGMHDLPVDDEAHLLFSCPDTAVVRRMRRFAQLPFASLQDLLCYRDVYTWFVVTCNDLSLMCTGWHCLCTSA
jgi:hypothetical protein